MKKMFIYYVDRVSYFLLGSVQNKYKEQVSENINRSKFKETVEYITLYLIAAALHKLKMKTIQLNY